MKIGILTFTNGTNYGQRLQNYSLQTVIRNMGHEVYTIKQEYPFSKTKLFIKQLFKFAKSPISEFKINKRKLSFEKFNKDYISFYPKKLKFHGDNTWISRKFDKFVVGSDQIWNPNSPFVGENFFLKFAERKQRVTYAPSFSVDSIPDNNKDKYTEYLNGFDNLTVREHAGAEIVCNLTGRKAEVVIDPTLLLEKSDWDKIKTLAHGKPNGKYILCLFLGDNPTCEVELVSKKLKMKCLCLDKYSNQNPSEFLDLIDGASLVLTDSYHITIFSIIYKKPFINFQRSGKGIEMNSRFATLYSKLGIENRWWNYLKDVDELWLNIDYSNIDNKKNSERKKALQIIEDSLQD